MTVAVADWDGLGEVGTLLALRSDLAAAQAQDNEQRQDVWVSLVTREHEVWEQRNRPLDTIPHTQ